MGSKTSGRFKKGTKIVKLNQKDFDLKKQNNILKSTTENQKVETPRIESIEENLDFDSNANRILAESEQALASEKPKLQSVQQNNNPEVIERKKEDWTPVASMIMYAFGSLFESATGIKELNYTKSEVDECSPAISNLINIWFPDADALTEDQKVILISTSIIAKVHAEKLKIYFDHKNKKALDESQTTTEQISA